MYCKDATPCQHPSENNCNAPIPCEHYTVKRKPKPVHRERPVVAVTLSEMALQKLDQLKRLYGKTYASHTVEKIIEDTWAREIGTQPGNIASTAPGHSAGSGGPGEINQLNDATPRIIKTKVKP